MKKHLINFALIAFSVLIFLGGLLTYHNYFSSAAEEERNEILAENGDVIRITEDVSLTVNKTSLAQDDSEQNVELPIVEKKEETLKEPVIVSTANCPGDILNLASWKQTLPTGESKKPAEIKQPALAKFSDDICFKINPTKDGVVFRAPVNGVTTSNSGYPRSELREMSADGKENASWSTSSGTHTMFIDQAITAVPQTKKHIVAGQIHDEDDDVIVIRLEYPKLFVDINGKTGPTLDENYTLGKRFNVKFLAENDKIKIYYNGNEKPAYELSKKASGCYFKAGAYAQSNCSKEKNCSSDNFGEVVIYNLAVSHS